MNPRRWLHDHSLKLLAIRDTPEAIAGGVAIGIFFGFTPLIFFKTLSAILFAWLTRCNILAAVLAVSFHDIIFWLMPAVYLWEYEIGYWLLSHPHQMPHASMLTDNLRPHAWHSWTTFLRVGKPMLLGSIFCGGPIAVLAFALTTRIVTRHQHKRKAQEAIPDEEGVNPT